MKNYLYEYGWVLGKIPFLKLFLHKLSNLKIYKNQLRKRRKYLYEKNGLRVLELFDRCLTDNGFRYSLAFGSMLGAIREHGFIKHDIDIDVAMWIEDYNSSLRGYLENAGFRMTHELLVDNGNLGREETYMKDGVSIDIFYIFPPIDKYPYCCLFLNVGKTKSLEESMKKYGYIIPQRVQLPWNNEIIRVPFEGISLPIASDAHKILSYRYGDDYMIPNPHWTYFDRTHSDTIWQEKKGTAIFY